MEIQFPVEFVVHGTPISLAASSRSKQRWKATVKEASYTALPEQHIWYEGPVCVTIYYFPTEPMPGDIDNIIKMTLDALSNHILKDDRQIERIVAQKFNPNGGFAFTDASEVLEGAIISDEPVVYIRLSSDPYEDLR
jgi:crossover junction endodeoxyribonuclease RusA